jgi:hypothetical protein
VAAEVRHDTHKRKHLAFRGSFPPVGIDAINGRQIRAVEGVSDENVARGGDLRSGQGYEHEEHEGDDQDIAHEASPAASFEPAETQKVVGCAGDKIRVSPSWLREK